EAVRREGREEFGIEVGELEKHGKIKFIFPEKPDWDQIVHVFICRNWVGEPQESEEMRPEWFLLSEIPYKLMWWDDQYWLPKVLKGETIEGYFEFDNEEKVTKQLVKVL